MADLEQFHDLRGYAKAYPEKIFTPLSQAERDALPPGTVDRLSAEMGRHFAPTFTRAAVELERRRPAPATELPAPDVVGQSANVATPGAGSTRNITRPLSRRTSNTRKPECVL